jgi:hypothetical protein
MYNLRVQPWDIVTRTWLGGRNMGVVKFIGTLPSGDKQVEVANPTKGYNYYVFKEDLPKSEKKPWYNMGEGLFKGQGIGLGNRKQGTWLLIIIIAYAIYKIAKR